MVDQLTLAERLFLLTHDPDRHFEPMASVTTLGTALAGAVLADLVLDDRIVIDPAGLIHATHRPHRSTHPILTEVAALVRTGEPCLVGGRNLHQPFPARDVTTLIRADLYERTRAGLVAAGILARTDHRRLGVFPRDRYFATDPRLPVRLRAEIRRAVLRPHEPTRLVTDAVCTLIRALRLVEVFILPLSTDDAISRLNHIVRRVTRLPSPFCAIADIGVAVETAAATRLLRDIPPYRRHDHFWSTP